MSKFMVFKEVFDARIPDGMRVWTAGTRTHQFVVVHETQERDDGVGYIASYRRVASNDSLYLRIPTVRIPGKWETLEEAVQACRETQQDLRRMS